jgi:hypothetical protein
MAVTRTFAAGPDQFYQQIDNIIKSHSLRGSESLCKLLQYLAKQSLEHPDAPLKEYQIATEVYGRPPGFDPQSDSTIRVQAGRLRLKLAEYYAGEGVADPIIVKIPKGNYHLTFEARPLASLVPSQATVRDNGPREDVSEAIPVRWRLMFILLVIGLAASLVALGILWNRKLPQANVNQTDESRVSGPVATFWRPFTSGAEEPWVIFSNAAFVGRPETGMRYYKSGQDANSPVYDHYTGVGEVLAIHALDDVFGSLGRRIRVKRGSLFTLDDVKNNNLIFVGSPSENLSLLDIPGTQDFVFQRVPSGPRQGDLSIVNKHPKPGEASAYMASPSNTPLTEDYAVVGLLPGSGSGQFVMILAGTTTFGTQGAVEFVSRQETVEQLLKAMPNTDAGSAKTFEALVRVKIARGVPVSSELVTIRAR